MPHAAAVLYVEDDRINIVLMEEVFRLLPGWQLDCAEDGMQALAMLGSLQPTLVVIDMNLPDMSGCELLQQLRADPRRAGLLCVALSADDQREQIDAAMAAGFNDYWVKPIDVPRMALALRKALRT